MNPASLNGATPAFFNIQPGQHVKPQPTTHNHRLPWPLPTHHLYPLQDTLIYAALCPKLGNRRVAVKMYDKTKVQATKYRAIKREIAMMMYFMHKR